MIKKWERFDFNNFSIKYFKKKNGFLQGISKIIPDGLQHMKNFNYVFFQ